MRMYRCTKEAMVPPQEKEDYLANLNDLCHALFESFCERRSIVALAYMMHAWPLVTDQPGVYRRLLQTLADLRRWHEAELNDTEKFLTARILSKLRSRVSLP
ncbi:hypothetical protein [Paraburkholderia sp. JHI869]|uniref:hypothetical protein n=1 Tax=Paraburkholderia sp. JHI869 TaxID=3112959 RepID=UPI00319E0B5E